jgi:hypothetical protein
MGEKKKYPVLRIIALVIVAGLFLFGAYLYWGSYKLFVQFDSWFAAKPVDIEVDFSKVGTYSSRFEQICSVSHGEYLGLELPNSVLVKSKVQSLLRGLKANCIISDSNGSEIASVDLSAGNVLTDEPFCENIVLLNMMQRIKNGTYKISVSVMEGAPALSGIEQRFVAKYQLCGLERMPGVVLRLASIACFIIGGIIILAMFLIAVIKTRKNSPPTSS